MSWQRPRRRRRATSPSRSTATATAPTSCSAIARGGLLVAGALSYALGVKNTFTMNVEFYTGIDERLDMPMLLPPVPDLVDFARDARPDRRRRRRHRRDARAREGLLRGQGGRGALRRALREVALDGALRVRLEPHRPLDRLPLERRGAGAANCSPRSPVTQSESGVIVGRPRTHRHFRGEAHD